jgi:hypothetical protein
MHVFLHGSQMIEKSAVLMCEQVGAISPYLLFLSSKAMFDEACGFELAVG